MTEQIKPENLSVEGLENTTTFVGAVMSAKVGALIKLVFAEAFNDSFGKTKLIARANLIMSREDALGLLGHLDSILNEKPETRQ